MKPVFVKRVSLQAWVRRCALVILLTASCNLASPQRGGELPPMHPGPDDIKLPNGKSQHDAILKAEHETNLRDVAQLVDLAQQLQQDLEKNDTFVFSISTLKKTDDIEKLLKKIRSRLRH
jgi:hypothetical protein